MTVASRGARAPRWLCCLCIVALGCRAPTLSGTRPDNPLDVSAQWRPTSTSTAAAAGIKRLPPVAADAPRPNAPGDIRLVSGQSVQSGESQPAENLPPPAELSPLIERLKIPGELPGASAPSIRVPSLDVITAGERNEVIDELFPSRPPLPRLMSPAAPPMNLSAIEQLALANNPELVQAMATITSTTGDAMQAGTAPNPTIGYESDTVGSFGTRNYQGVYGTQLIKTAGKLGLQRAVANVAVANAQLEMRKTRIDVLSRVKSGYYAVLVAQQNLAITSALAWFTNEAYRIQVDKLRAGEATSYEPAQLRTLAKQAEAAQVQAQMRYVSAWKQLAALIGVPTLPTAELEGRADMPVRPIDYEEMLARVLNNHPDVMAARNTVGQAQLQLQLDRTIPIPDVQLYGTFQKDFTTPGTPRTTYNVQFGLPMPIFDRNRGNILSAEGDLRRATEQVRKVQNTLTAASADAFERFETNRVMSQYYRDQILPDLARAYRGVYDRHQLQPDEVGFGDIIVAQQNLAVAVGVYIGSLNAQWSALADIANLMQVEDFQQIHNPAGGAAGAELNPPIVVPKD
jgi:outer membrane protein, heavy metal efflux system